MKSSVLTSSAAGGSASAEYAAFAFDGLPATPIVAPVAATAAALAAPETNDLRSVDLEEDDERSEEDDIDMEKAAVMPMNARPARIQRSFVMVMILRLVFDEEESSTLVCEIAVI